MLPENIALLLRGIFLLKKIPFHDGKGLIKTKFWTV